MTSPAKKTNKKIIRCVGQFCETARTQLKLEDAKRRTRCQPARASAGSEADERLKSGVELRQASVASYEDRLVKRFTASHQLPAIRCPTRTFLSTRE